MRFGQAMGHAGKRAPGHIPEVHISFIEPPLLPRPEVMGLCSDGRGDRLADPPGLLKITLRQDTGHEHGRAAGLREDTGHARGRAAGRIERRRQSTAGQRCVTRNSDSTYHSSCFG